MLQRNFPFIAKTWATADVKSRGYQSLNHRVVSENWCQQHDAPSSYLSTSLCMELLLLSQQARYLRKGNHHKGLCQPLPPPLEDDFSFFPQKQIYFASKKRPVNGARQCIKPDIQPAPSHHVFLAICKGSNLIASLTASPQKRNRSPSNEDMKFDEYNDDKRSYFNIITLEISCLND